MPQNRTLDCFDDEHIPNLFRFRSKQQILDLIDAFEIPDRIITERRHAYTGLVVLISLDRLGRPTRLCDVSFIFGIEISAASRIFKWFVTFFCTNWRYLLTDNLAFWMPYFEDFKEAIRTKVNNHDAMIASNFVYPANFQIFGFIDYTMNATCRPGGGPVYEGDGVRRNDPDLQRAWYS
jgi:hypothetical protein